MLTRRIAVSVCALCLAIPAAAGASEGTNQPNGNPASGPPSTVKAKGPYNNLLTGPPSTVKAKGPYGTSVAGQRSTVKAKGPYGIAPRYGIRPNTGSPSTTAASIHRSGTPLRDDTNGWRTAAISEAALLAALLLGWALLLTARRRAAHMAT
jgi:hypothetical protein